MERQRHTRREEEKLCETMEAEKPRPVVIAVMGMTGVGKSTFVKLLTQDDSIAIGNTLESGTVDVQPSQIILRSDGAVFNLIFIDTPGFDDGNQSDTDILIKLTDWLMAHYDQDIPLAGIIYLRRITDERMSGASKRNLRMMQKLIGDKSMKNVVLVTSRWEQVASMGEQAQLQAENREKQLLEGAGSASAWHEMLQHGATYQRHDGSLESATRLIRTIFRNSPTYLAFQREIASGKALSETAAGRVLLNDLEESIQKQRAAAAKLHAEIDALKQEGEGDAPEEYLEDLKQSYQKLRGLEEAKSRFIQWKKAALLGGVVAALALASVIAELVLT